MRTTGRRKTTSHAWKKQGPGKNSACPLISSRSPHTRSDQSEPTYLRGNPAHGRAAFSRRANRRSTLRIFLFRWPVDESGDRRNVFSCCLKRLVLLIMIGDFQNGGNFPSVPRFPSGDEKHENSKGKTPHVKPTCGPPAWKRTGESLEQFLVCAAEYK